MGVFHSVFVATSLYIGLVVVAPTISGQWSEMQGLYRELKVSINRIFH